MHRWPTQAEHALMVMLGDSYSRRRYPRIRESKGSWRNWRRVSGPYRTRRKAFRVARRMRDAGRAPCHARWKQHAAPLYAVRADMRQPHRKTCDWWVVEWAANFRRTTDRIGGMRCNRYTEE